MRHYLSLFVTASFLFTTQSVLASSVDDDNALSQNNPAASSALVQTDEPLQCYYTVRGVRKPLFDQDGQLLDQRAQEPRSEPTMTSVEKDGKKLWTNVLSGLAHHVRVAVIECLQDDPRGQLSLMSVSHGFRRLALILPERYNDAASTGNDLKRHLFTVLIGGQTGDLDLFIKDNQFNAFQTQSLQDLQDTFASRYYNGTLSETTKHGKTYRNIGSKIARGSILDLRTQNLRLVPVNFPEASTILRLYLANNQLRVLPDLSPLTKLNMLNLSNNQLSDVSDLSHLTKLSRLHLSNNQLSDVSGIFSLTKLLWLHLSNNQLTGIPGISSLTNLESLMLSNNQLTSAPNVMHLTNLEFLHLDAPLCQDETLRETLKNLNRNRTAGCKVKLIAHSKDPQGKDVEAAVPYTAVAAAVRLRGM